MPAIIELVIILFRLWFDRFISLLPFYFYFWLYLSVCTPHYTNSTYLLLICFTLITLVCFLVNYFLRFVLYLLVDIFINYIYFIESLYILSSLFFIFWTIISYFYYFINSYISSIYFLLKLDSSGTMNRNWLIFSIVDFNVSWYLFLILSSLELAFLCFDLSETTGLCSNVNVSVVWKNYNKLPMFTSVWTYFY